MTEIRKFDWGAVTTGSTKQKPKAEKQEESRARYYSPRRARLNIIPDMEELSRRINDALNALSKGVYWDRGSIVNIIL